MQHSVATPSVAEPVQNVSHWKRLHDEGYFASHPWYKDRLHDLGVPEICSRLDLHPTHTLLEVGCGYGRLLWHLLPKVRRVIGVDLHEQPLAEARDLLAPRGDADMRVGDGLSLNVVESGSVDRAVAFTVLQHMTHPGATEYLREMKRVLAPGGLGLVNFHDETRERRTILDRPGEQSSTTSPAQIATMAERAGITIERIERQSLDHLYPGRGYLWWWLTFS